MTVTIKRNPIWIGGPESFAGMRVIEDQFCLEKTNERTFPISRHRSARIHKKLVRRFGGEFKMKPAMFIVGGHTILAHPAIYNEVKRQLSPGGNHDCHKQHATDWHPSSL